MTIGLSRKENAKEKLPIKNTNHLGRLLQKLEVPHKRVEKGSAYYLKKQ